MQGSMKLLSLKSLSLLIAAFALSPTWAEANSEKQWQEIRSVWSELGNARQSVVSNLHLKVPTRKTRRGNSGFQFPLEDQLGKAWIFKSQPTPVDGAVAIDKIATIVGVPSIPVYPYRLTLNGHPLSGLIQFGTPGAMNLRTFALSEIAADGILDLAKHHVLSWLLLNHQVHYRQFMLGRRQMEDGLAYGSIFRTENSVEWYLVDHDRLAVDFKSPLLWTVAAAGNVNLFRNYIGKTIDIDLSKLFVTIELLRTMPNDLFLEIFAPMQAANGLDGYGSVSESRFKKMAPEYGVPKSAAQVRDGLLNRKKNLKKDFIKFYRELAALRGETWVEPKIDLAMALKERHAQLQSDLVRWRQYLAALEKKDGGSKGGIQSVSVVASSRAYGVIAQAFGEIDDLPKAGRTKIFERTLAELKALEKAETDEFERGGVRIAVSALEQFMSAHEKGRIERNWPLAMALPTLFTGSVGQPEKKGTSR